MDKKQKTTRRSVTRAIRWPIALAVALTMSVSFMPHAEAQADDVGKILKRMSDYMSSQKTLSLTYDTDIEVITPEMQKI